MAFDQPFTCTSQQHLCLSAPQRCCAGKRHCCNCKKFLPPSANALPSASRPAAASATMHGGARGVHSAADENGGDTPLKASGTSKTERSSAAHRPRKRLFASLAAGANTEKDQGAGRGHNIDGDDVVERAAGGHTCDGAGGGDACMSRGAACDSEGQLQHEVEDVASMLLLFCSARCSFRTTTFIDVLGRVTVSPRHSSHSFFSLCVIIKLLWPWLHVHD